MSEEKNETKYKNLPLSIATANHFEDMFVKFKKSTGKSMREFAELVIVHGLMYVDSEFLRELEKTFKKGMRDER